MDECKGPDIPSLCVNNCGFFGSITTRHMCSKCHREALLKEDRAKLAVTSIANCVDGISTKGNEAVRVNVMPAIIHAQASCDSSVGMPPVVKTGPNRCTTCRKRVGLLGFSCRCGNLFCSSHRSSDKHDCPFDYQLAARGAIAKANPIIKAAKLQKI